jgi:hypothetical protein
MANEKQYLSLKQRRANLVERLAAASRQMMFAAGVDSPGFQRGKVECVSLRAAIARVKREMDDRDLERGRRCNFYVGEPSLIIGHDQGDIPCGSCSLCPLVTFQLILIGTAHENFADLRVQFECHINALHSRLVPLMGSSVPA